MEELLNEMLVNVVSEKYDVDLKKLVNLRDLKTRIDERCVFVLIEDVNGERCDVEYTDNNIVLSIKGRDDFIHIKMKDLKIPHKKIIVDIKVIEIMTF